MSLRVHFWHRYFSNCYSQAGYSRHLLSIKVGQTELRSQFVAVYRDFIECAKEFKAVIQKIQTHMKNWYAYCMY
jgi:hypothetical protein